MSIIFGGGGGSTRRGSFARTVPNAAGPLGVNVPTQGLKKPVSYSRKSGSANLSVDAATGLLSAATGLRANVTQSCVVIVTGADECTVPVDVTLIGIVGAYVAALRFNDPRNSMYL